MIISMSPLHPMPPRHNKIAERCRFETYVSTWPTHTEIYYYWRSPRTGRNCAAMHYDSARKMWFCYIDSSNTFRYFADQETAFKWIKNQKYKESK